MWVSWGLWHPLRFRLNLHIPLGPNLPQRNAVNELSIKSLLKPPPPPGCVFPETWEGERNTKKTRTLSFQNGILMYTFLFLESEALKIPLATAWRKLSLSSVQTKSTISPSRRNGSANRAGVDEI